MCTEILILVFGSKVSCKHIWMPLFKLHRCKKVVQWMHLQHLKPSKMEFKYFDILQKLFFKTHGLILDLRNTGFP